MPSNQRDHVFISYSHDSAKHMERVLELSDWLRQRGIDCNLDRYEESPSEGWGRWSRNQIIEADFVLVVCTETYQRRFSGKEQVGAGRGVKWEGAILNQELYEAEARNKKFIPVVFLSGDTPFIPIELRGATHYDASTEEGRTQLYRRLTDQPLIQKPELGKIQSLPARKQKSNFQTRAITGTLSPRHANPVREFAGKYWRIGVLLMVSLPIAFAMLKIVGLSIESLTGLATTRMADYWIIGVGSVMVILVSIPRVAWAITFTIRGRPTLAPLESTIFRGPQSYGPHDHLPGRKRELDACRLRFRDQRFFILDGESGCGKSSFLNAALLPQCRETLQVVECRIADDPFGKLYHAVLNKTYRRVDPPIDETQLASALIGGAEQNPNEARVAHSPPILVCMDQFEEVFVTVKDEARRGFFIVLRQAIEEGTVRVLVAIRSDFRDLLDKACRDVDPEQTVLDAGSYYSLNTFRKEQAGGVLDELFAPLYGTDSQFNKQLDDFAMALVNDLLRPPRDRRLSHLDEKTVLPVELQTVGMMIEQIGIRNFSVIGLGAVGGELGLLRRYIDEAKDYVWRRTGVPGDQALLILRQLISPVRTKWAQTAQSIGKARSIPTKKVEKVLEGFAARYLVNPLPDEDGTEDGLAKPPPRYELMHEHLIQILTEAPDPVLQKARDAEERLIFWRERAKNQLSDPVTPNSLPSRIRTLFRMPIPLGESLRLWRFASIPADRLMLRHNLRGFALRMAAAALLILGPGLVWLYSPWGQIQLVKWDIAKLSSGNDQGTLRVIAIGLPSAGYPQQAAEVAGRIDEHEPFAKVRALGAMAKATVQVGDASQAAELLKQVAEVAGRIDLPAEKAEALGEVAKATAQVGHWRQARDYAAQNTTNEGRAMALIAILQVWHGVEEKAVEKKNGIDE